MLDQVVLVLQVFACPALTALIVLGFWGGTAFVRHVRTAHSDSWPRAGFPRGPWWTNLRSEVDARQQQRLGTMVRHWLTDPPKAMRACPKCRRARTAYRYFMVPVVAYVLLTIVVYLLAQRP